MPRELTYPTSTLNLIVAWMASIGWKYCEIASIELN
jgi:hypothetical protein